MSLMVSILFTFNERYFVAIPFMLEASILEKNVLCPNKKYATKNSRKKKQKIEEHCFPNRDFILLFVFLPRQRMMLAMILASPSLMKMKKYSK